MIPLFKLERLPRTQRLRKIAKLSGEAEQRLIRGENLQAGETAYLADTLTLLVSDAAFAPAVREALTEAGALLRSSCSAAGLRRALNTVKHLLTAETGRYPADWDFLDSGGSLDPGKRQVFEGMQVYLEDIRSPFNVGAMFRTAESFGVEKMFLSPFCADPGHPRAQRTAMGCVGVLPWERLDADPFAGAPGEEAFGGMPLFALETGGVPLEEFPFPPRGIMIAGSEELGVSPAALAAASLGRVSIRTFGAKGSLNVSTAFGIVMQAWAAALQ